jgi:hypothetical protein
MDASCAFHSRSQSGVICADSHGARLEQCDELLMADMAQFSRTWLMLLAAGLTTLGRNDVHGQEAVTKSGLALRMEVFVLITLLYPVDCLGADFFRNDDRVEVSDFISEHLPHWASPSIF